MQYFGAGRAVLLLGWLSWAIHLAAAYKVPFTDSDYSRQACSGMWGGDSAFINVTFDSASSQGQVSMVIYEWKDVDYLGKVTSETDDSLPRTYVCTTDALKAGFCDVSQLGTFILDLPPDKPANETSFWLARLSLTQVGESDSSESLESTGGLWDNPEGNPIVPPEDYTSPWRSRSVAPVVVHPRQSQSGALSYKDPIQYEVRYTGYYCVAIVPVTVLNGARQASTDVPYHPTYNGVILFQNTFSGELAAADYPKVNFYFVMFLAYVAFGSLWAWQCYKHVTELLPIQHYLSGLVGFLVVEMIASWVYYRYLNAHGRNTAATVFLFVVSILDAGRNALSFFMLLVVALGLSVVREDLGRTMLRCQILAGAHFIFGVLYGVGIVELELESTSALILLMFIIPLAFTLSGFFMWILYALNGTMTNLAARKQRYKLTMFKRLYHILLATVIIIAVFFVISTLSFSDRYAEDYAAKSWRTRWWLLDGYLAILYFVAFWAIAYLWRPTETNRRLAMSEELAQEDEDAEDYDLESLSHRGRDDDEITLVNNRREPEVADDNVVFEIGDEEDDDLATSNKKRRSGRGDDEEGHEDERAGLMRDE